MPGITDLILGGPAPSSDPEVRGITSRILSAPEEKAKGLAQRVGNLFTGADETEFPGIPDIGDVMVPPPLGFLVASDAAQKVDILRKAYPKSKITADKFGNPIIEVKGIKGGRAYVQKPGAQVADVSQFGAQLLGYIGGLGLASKVPAIGRVLQQGNLLQRVPVVGGVAGLTSAGFDLAASATGSEQGVNVPRMLTTAAIGAGAEVASPLLSRIGRALARDPGLVDDFGVTGQGERVLRQAGIDPAGVTDELAAHFRDLARIARDPVDAARLAQSSSLPVPVPETRGSISLSPRQQMTESMARKGAYGQSAEDIMRAVESRQQEALRANIPAIQARLSGGVGPLVSEAGQGGAMVQEALLGASARSKAAVKTAYKVSDATPALIRFEGAAGLADQMEAAAQPYLRHAKQAERQLSEYRRLIGDAPIDTPGILTSQIFDWRRDTSKILRTLSDRTEASAMRGMLRSFDENVEGAVKQNLMIGNEDAARYALRAIGIKRGEVQRFQAGDLISDLLETEAKGRGMRLTVAPEQAANYILGAADTGFIGRPQLARDLGRLKARLGPESQPWLALKEEAFLRFARKAEGASAGDTRLFSGVNLRKSWADSWKKNPQVMRVFFNDKEKRLVDQFVTVAARVTGKVPGGDNPSGTAVAMANALQNMTSGLLLGPTGQALLSRLLPPIYDVVQAGALRRSALNPLPKIGVPGGYGGAIGAGALGPLTVPQSIQYPNQRR